MVTWPTRIIDFSGELHKPILQLGISYGLSSLTELPPPIDQPHKLLHSACTECSINCPACCRCRGVRGGSDRIGAGMRARSQKLYGTYMRSYLDAGMLFTVSPWSAATASNSLKDADL